MAPGPSPTKLAMAYLHPLLRRGPVIQAPRKTWACRRQLGKAWGLHSTPVPHLEEAPSSSQPGSAPGNGHPSPFHVRVHGYAATLAVLFQPVWDFRAETKAMRPQPLIPSLPQSFIFRRPGSHPSKARAPRSQEGMFWRRFLSRSSGLTHSRSWSLLLLRSHRPLPQTPL